MFILIVCVFFYITVGITFSVFMNFELLSCLSLVTGNMNILIVLPREMS